MFWVTVRERVKCRGQYTPPPIYFDPTEKSYYIWTASQPTQHGISFVSASWSNQQQNNVDGSAAFKQGWIFNLFNCLFLARHFWSSTDQQSGRTEWKSSVQFQIFGKFSCRNLLTNSFNYSLLYAEPCSSMNTFSKNDVFIIPEI